MVMDLSWGHLFFSMVHPGSVYLWGLAFQPHPIDTIGFPIYSTGMCSMSLRREIC